MSDLDPSDVKVIAFDVFNTVVQFADVPHEEKKAYADHIHRPEWFPLHLPESWKTLPAYADSREGIERLKKKFIVVACSNGPVPLQVALAKHNDIAWDWIVPLELRKVYKPSANAYLLIAQSLQVMAHEVVMVTANKDFGDISGSLGVGMKPMLIRNPGCPQTIIELAELLGC
jgi:HAD superfamily hydrolase (TIGR01493 family)